MAHIAVDISCPGCGAPVNTGTKECVFCHRPVVISTFNSVYSMPVPELNKYAAAYKGALAANPENGDLSSSIAMCYLKLKLYDKAVDAFEKAIENNFDNSETYFYYAVSLLKGKKAFLATREVIDKILEYIEAAILIEPRGIYHYFSAYIKHDYHERKFLNITTNYSEELQLARENNVTFADAEMLVGILGKPMPDELKL